MKHFYTSKSLLKFSFLFLFVLSVFSLTTSCKNDDDDDEEFTDHLVQFQVKSVKGGAPAGTEKVELKTIVTQVGTAQNTFFVPATPGMQNWSSEEFFVNSSQAQLNLDANATLPNGDSELSVTILVDGEVAVTKKVIGSGTQSVSVDFSFLEL